MSVLKEKDKHIINNWYIACLSHELKKNAPLSRMIYDTPYVLFRDEKGEAVCLVDRCLHRHAYLSKGEVVNGKLQCPYHGWSYNSEGLVVSIPSEGAKNPVQQRHCSTALPLDEKDGAIWIYTGEKAPQKNEAPWRFAHANDPTLHHYFMITPFENEVTNLAENFMDVPHTAFVHRGWFRDSNQVKNTMDVDVQNGQVLVTYKQKDDEFSWFAKFLLNPKNKPMIHTDHFIYPNITKVDYIFGDNAFVINSQITPVSDLKSIVYTYIGYKVGSLAKFLKPIFRFYTRQVIEQDVRIMKNQGDNLRHFKSTNFRSTEVDEVHKAIERVRHYGRTNDPKLQSFTSHKTVDFYT